MQAHVLDEMEEVEWLLRFAPDDLRARLPRPRAALPSVPHLLSNADYEEWNRQQMKLLGDKIVALLYATPRSLAAKDILPKLGVEVDPRKVYLALKGRAEIGMVRRRRALRFYHTRWGSLARDYYARTSTTNPGAFVTITAA